MKTIATTLSLLLLTACAATPPQSKQERLLAVVRAVGDPLVMTYGYELAEKNVPELLPVLDANGDKIITVAEVEAAVRSIDEATATLLLAQVVSRLVAK